MTVGWDTPGLWDKTGRVYALRCSAGGTPCGSRINPGNPASHVPKCHRWASRVSASPVDPVVNANRRGGRRREISWPVHIVGGREVALRILSTLVAAVLFGLATASASASVLLVGTYQGIAGKYTSRTAGTTAARSARATTGVIISTPLPATTQESRRRHPNPLPPTRSRVTRSSLPRSYRPGRSRAPPAPTIRARRMS